MQQKSNELAEMMLAQQAQLLQNPGEDINCSYILFLRLHILQPLTTLFVGGMMVFFLLWC